MFKKLILRSPTSTKLDNSDGSISSSSECFGALNLTEIETPLWSEFASGGHTYPLSRRHGADVRAWAARGAPRNGEI